MVMSASSAPRDLLVVLPLDLADYFARDPEDLTASRISKASSTSLDADGAELRQPIESLSQCIASAMTTAWERSRKPAGAAEAWSVLNQRPLGLRRWRRAIRRQWRSRSRRFRTFPSGSRYISNVGVFAAAARGQRCDCYSRGSAAGGVEGLDGHCRFCGLVAP